MYMQALTKEEPFWKEKVGDKVIMDNDRNTYFFHAKVKANRRQAILRLKLDDNSDAYINDLSQITRLQQISSNIFLTLKGVTLRKTC